MWILECDGDILQGKRTWLRPGKKYLFGRTRLEGGRYAGFAISHKSVSRKHLTLSVSKVKLGDGNLADSRSELSLEDEKTKIGTEIDGVRVFGERVVLRNDEHVFFLGKYEHLFRIKWVQVVLSFTFPSKDTKDGKDPLILYRAQLEDLDIKTILTYIVDRTTHVVAGKWNTAKCLQALINSKPIVDKSYISALVEATTSNELEVEESLSLLEQDFDKNWPKEENYLPAPNREPGQRSTELFAPDPARKEIFKNYTFVICDLRQFENLQAPITNGAGKALYLSVENGNTTASEIVEYVKCKASDKGLLVRFNGEKGYEEWATRLQIEVSRLLGQELVEQNEFLDVILLNDPTKLRRQVPGGSFQSQHPAPEENRFNPQKERPMQDSAQPPSEPGIEPPEPPPRRTRLRGTIKSAFTGFDDGFDPSQIKPLKRSASANSYKANTSFDAPISPNGDVIMEESAKDDQVTPRQSRKRPAPVEESDEDEKIMNDKLLPAVAAMKRRRLEAGEEARRYGASTDNTKVTSKAAPGAASATRQAKQIDIQEAAREHREKQDAKTHHDEESIQQAIDNMTVEDMMNLAVIEEMELPERARSNGQTNGHSDRWDPAWNGRKNFKKFRRQGEGTGPRRGQTVIVPLEEVKKKSQGLGEEYWLESSSSNKRRRREEELGRARDAEERQDRSPSFTSGRSRHHEEAVPAELASVPGARPEVIDVDAPRTTRLADKTSEVEERSNKRAAPGAAVRRGATKRQKTLPYRDESDSEDDMKFRFQKKR